MPSLFPIPTPLDPSATVANRFYTAGRFQETIGACEEQLETLEPKLLMRSNKSPSKAEAGSDLARYYALTVLLVNALAGAKEWKMAKEVLGKYRVRFPHDAWGFRAGAEVTRRDPAVKDKAAVERAAELLQGEAERLETL